MNERMTRWLLAGVVAAGGGMVGFILGRPDTGYHDEPSSTIARETSEDGGMSIGPVLTDTRVKTNSKSSFTANPVGDVSPSTVQEIIDRFDDILAIEDYAVRRYYNEVLFDNMTAEQAPDVLAALLKLPPRAKEAQLMLFFAGWGRVDGPAAVEASLEIDSRRRVGSTAAALNAWSWTDPDAAWETARTLTNGWPALGSRIGGIVTSFAKKDLATAIALRDDMNGPIASRTIQGAVIDFALEEGKLDVVFHEVAQFESLKDQKAWLSDIFSRWGRLDENAPLAALENITNPAIAESAMAGFLNGWTATDPEGALDYLLAHPDNPASATALPAALRQVLYNGDRETTLQLIERVAETQDMDKLGPPMLSTLAFAQPEISLKLAGMLSDEQQRERYTALAVNSWAQCDYDSAASYFERMPDGAAKIQAFHSLTYTTLSREDGGGRIARWIEALPPGGDRTKAVESMLNTAANPQFTISAGSKRTLQRIVGQTSELSEEARAKAAKLFGN